MCVFPYVKKATMEGTSQKLIKVVTNRKEEIGERRQE